MLTLLFRFLLLSFLVCLLLLRFSCFTLGYRYLALWEHSHSLLDISHVALVYLSAFPLTVFGRIGNVQGQSCTIFSSAC